MYLSPQSITGEQSVPLHPSKRESSIKETSFLECLEDYSKLLIPVLASMGQKEIWACVKFTRGYFKWETEHGIFNWGNKGRERDS